MRAYQGRELAGPAGLAIEIIVEDPELVDQRASVAQWFMVCPMQSPLWERYLLSVVHLRDIDGQSKPPDIITPHATHEIMLIALDPTADPQPTDPSTWSFLTPLNMVVQVELPSDEKASELAMLITSAIVTGYLPAEPPFPGGSIYLQPVLTTCAHLRGEAHVHGDRLIIPEEGPDAPTT